MEILPFKSDYIPAAAALFIQPLKRLRETLPILPDRLEDPAVVAEKLRQLAEAGPMFAALQDGSLVGYLGGYLIEKFRNTDHKAAYCPEWGHAAADSVQPAVYRALYRAAAAEWTLAGCHTHAITLLAFDPVVEKVWFWNGFGLAVVDAVRPLTPLGIVAPQGFTVRQATLTDVELLAVLEAEHARHYAQPPILMVPFDPADAAAFAELINQPSHSVWLAEQDGDPMGYMRFEGRSSGAVEVVSAEAVTACTGAYIRPAYRGRRAAVALLDAALSHYATLGFACCSVDFESLNPEATAFWMKYFTPVCLSLLRVPESLRLPEAPGRYSEGEPT